MANAPWQALLSPASGPRSATARALCTGFGALWLLDGILLAEPRMFAKGMVARVLAPATVGQPAWLGRFVSWCIHLYALHLVTFHVLLIAAQILAGLLLLAGARPVAARLGAALSVALGLGIWVCAEGLGQVLTGEATALSGAPGPALLYVLGGAILLMDVVAGRPSLPRRSPVTWALSAVFALAAALQVNPRFFTPRGLSAVFAQSALAPQPGLFEAPPAWLRHAALTHAASLNVAVVLAFALGAVAVHWMAARRVGLVATVGLVALVLGLWWFGEDLGMPFNGMATDPNTAGPLLVLVLAGRAAERELATGRASPRTPPAGPEAGAEGPPWGGL